MGLRLKKEYHWVGVRSILSRSLKGPALGDADPNDWLRFQWGLTVGPEIKAISSIQKLTARTLLVRVAGKEWIASLKSLERGIIWKINETAGYELLTKIKFIEGEIPKTPIENLPRRNPPQAQSEDSRSKFNPAGLDNQWKRDIKGSLEMIKDDDLKTILTRLMKKAGRLSLVLFGVFFIANCSTMPQPQPETLPGQTIDLSKSFAIKQKQIAIISKGEIFRDPRAYYHYLMALKADREFKFEDSIEHYSQVIQFDPESRPFYEKLAALQIMIGAIDDAFETASAAQKIYQDSPVILKILGDIHASRGNHEKALSHYRALIDLDPKKSRPYILSGIVHENNNQHDKARDTFKQGVQIDPINPLGHHYLGRALLRANRLEEAEKSLQKAVALRPNYVEAREHLAWVYSQLGKTEEATQEYKVLIKLKPAKREFQNRMASLQKIQSPGEAGAMKSSGLPDQLKNQPNIHLKIAHIYFEQAKYLKGLEEFRIVIANNPETVEPRIIVARIYELIGRVDLAIKEFLLVDKYRPNSVEVLLYTARLYSLINQTGEAVKLIERSIKIQPKNDTLYHALSLANMAEDDYDVAIRNVKRAIELNPKKDSYYFELGALLEREGLFEEAIKSMRRTIELNPLHSNAHNFLGYMYALEGKNLDKALDHLKKALSIQPRNGYFLDSLGWIYFKQGDSEKALTEVKKALVYTSPDPVLYDHMGDILYSLRYYSEASGAWKTSFSLTKANQGNVDGEMPDLDALQEKIDKVGEVLRQGF